MPELRSDLRFQSGNNVQPAQVKVLGVNRFPFQTTMGSSQRSSVVDWLTSPFFSEQTMSIYLRPTGYMPELRSNISFQPGILNNYFIVSDRSATARNQVVYILVARRQSEFRDLPCL